MPIIDEYSYLSHKQVLNKSQYSYNSYDFAAASDVGYRESPLYVNIHILGPHDKDLTISLAVRENDKSAPYAFNPVTIPKGELVLGKRISIPVPPISKKYRYLALQYMVAGSTLDSDPTTGATCPTAPFLDGPEELKNGITAYLSDHFVSDVKFARNNVDKVYTS